MLLRFSLLSLILFTFCYISMASPDRYKVDDQAISELIDSAAEITFTEANLSKTGGPFVGGASSDHVKLSGNSPAIAFILCSFFGYVGIHRLYMGTSALTFLLYVFTCGGCGILWLVDVGLLLLGIFENDIYMYQDHPGFFMWT